MSCVELRSIGIFWIVLGLGLLAVFVTKQRHSDAAESALLRGIATAGLAVLAGIVFVGASFLSDCA